MQQSHRQQRRTLLAGMAAWATAPLWWLAAMPARAAGWLTQAFEAQTTAEVLSALQVGEVPQQADIQLQAPQKAENGAVVQVEIETPAAAGDVREIRLLADANPTPLVVSVVLGKQVLPRLVTRIKMAQTGDLIALVQKRNGQLGQRRRQVVVLEDGCGGSEREEPFASGIKMRARPLEDAALGAGVVELKIIVLHPMRTGRSKNDDGQLIPAHFMQLLQVVLHGQVIIDVQTGTAISRNPYFTFYLRGASVGDVVTVNWQDNRGLEGHGQVTVST